MQTTLLSTTRSYQSVNMLAGQVYQRHSLRASSFQAVAPPPAPPPRPRAACQQQCRAIPAAYTAAYAAKGWTSFSSRNNVSAAAATSPQTAVAAGHELGEGNAETQQFCVVNFYHLVDVPSPQEEVEHHRRWVTSNGLDIRGRIYISAQGINAQFGGLQEHALQYVDWLKSQPLWQGLRHSVWPVDGHAFPKLRLKYKPNLISLAGGISGLPVTQAEARATPLQPAEWKQMIAQAQEKKVVVLDIRNDYEWDAGHFVGAERPQEEEFSETPVGEGEEDVPAPLKGADPSTPVMMYCTGGIRCDIYSTFLKSRGFKNLYTLEGGIQNYLRQEGGDHWKGSLYVFDARMAIAPEDASCDTAGCTLEDRPPLPAAVPCQVCGSPHSELPHVNCANIDCNDLFIACAACKAKYKGCCCEECMSAPRLLRPAKTSGGYYGSYGNYMSDETVGSQQTSARRREGRLARRARKREQLRERRVRQAEERQALKAAMKEAMAKLGESSSSSEDEGSSFTDWAQDQQKRLLRLQELKARREGAAQQPQQELQASAS